MRQLARWYNVDVSYEGKISAEQFNGRISRNVKASQLLKMLEFAGVKFKTTEKTIVVYGITN